MPLPEQAPAARPTSGNTVMSWHWLVVLRALRAGAAVAARVQAGDGAGLLVREDARTVDDARLLGRAERHLDHVDAEERRVRRCPSARRRSSPASSSPERTPPVPEP